MKLNSEALHTAAWAGESPDSTMANIDEAMLIGMLKAAARYTVEQCALELEAEAAKARIAVNALGDKQPPTVHAAVTATERALMHAAEQLRKGAP